MLDANMRGIAKDTLFFARVMAITKESPLYHLGVRQGQIMYSKMLEDNDRDPLVEFYIQDEWIEWRESSNLSTIIQYEGAADGTDFIEDSSKEKAMDILRNI